MKKLSLWAGVFLGFAMTVSGCDCHDHGRRAASTGAQINNIDPSSASVGSLIVISGQGFSLNPSDNIVRFGNGILGEVQTSTRERVIVRVPNGAMSGQVQVTVGPKTQVVASNFTITPSISSVVPLQASVGSQITISGFNFQNVTSANTVMINGVEAQVIASSYNSITVLVPNGARTGTLSVSTVDGTVFGGTLRILPSISIFNPTSGLPGTEVTLLGSNFGLNVQDNDVRFFDNIPAQVIAASYGELRVLVPAAAATGRISVTTADGTAITSSDFDVQELASLSGFAPAFGAPGSSIWIQGEQLTSVSPVTVRIDGQVCTILSLSDEGILVQLPSSASSGSLVVTLGQQGNVNLGQFDVRHSRFAYVANRGDHTISHFLVNSATGELRPHGFTYIESNAAPIDLSITPSGNFLYVSNSGKNTVSAYQVRPNGFLRHLENKNTGLQPGRLSMHPSGDFLYLAHVGSNSISVFSIEADGSLDPVQSIGTGATPHSLANDLQGRFLFVSHSNDGTVSSYEIEADGSMNLVETEATGTGPQGVAVSSDSRFLYVANSGSDNISVFAIGTDGSLNAVEIESSLQGPSSLRVDPTGRFLYVTNTNSDVVRAFSIASDGTLSAQGPAIGTGDAPGALLLDASGRVLVCNFASSNLSVFASDAETGALSVMETINMPDGLVPTRSGPSGIAIALGNQAVSLSPRLTYAANAADAVGGNSLSGYQIENASGLLTQIDADPGSPGQDMATGRAPIGIVSSASGRFLYVVNSIASTPAQSYVSVYRVEDSPQEGNLTALASIGANQGVAGKNPQALTLDASGRLLFVVNDTQLSSTGPARLSSSISVFQVAPEGSPQEGSLTGLAEIKNTSPNLLAYAKAALTNAKGDLLFVLYQKGKLEKASSTGSSAAENKSAIGVFRVAANLTDMPLLSKVNDFYSSSVGGRAMSMHPSGRWIYTSNAADTIQAGKLIKFSVQSNGHLLEQEQVATGLDPNGLVTDATGQFLYVANTGSNSISAFQVDPDSGSLTRIDADAGAPGIQDFVCAAAPFGLAVDAAGRFLKVTHATASGSVSSFAIQPDGSLVSNGAAVPAGKAPRSITVLSTVE